MSIEEVVEEKHIDTCENIEPMEKKNIEPITMSRFKKSIIDKKEKKEIYIPYSIKDIEKSILYYSRTCGEYEYARALEHYIVLLRRYNNKNKNLTIPVYPDFIKYKYPEKRYKRPSQFQNAGRTTSLPKILSP